MKKRIDELVFEVVQESVRLNSILRSVAQHKGVTREAILDTI